MSYTARKIYQKLRHILFRYYGSKLQTNADLKTTACCAASIPKKLRALLKDIHENVLEKFYGCGSPLPEGLEGCTVLDLGSGSGRDSFVGMAGGGAHSRVSCSRSLT